MIRSSQNLSHRALICPRWNWPRGIARYKVIDHRVVLRIGKRLRLSRFAPFTGIPKVNGNTPQWITVDNAFADQLVKKILAQHGARLPRRLGTVVTTNVLQRLFKSPKSHGIADSQSI